MTNSKGIAPVVIILILALTAGGALVLKPKFLHGDSKRADQSQAATVALLEAQKAQGAAAAASVAKIGEANSMAPESPAKDFIAKEVPLAISRLPSPDPRALLEAEKRRSAVMEGRLAEAQALYGQETRRSIDLAGKLEKAVAQRQAIDQKLEEVAAERRGAEGQRNLFIIVAVLVGCLWAYSKLFGVNAGTLGRIVADIRAGGNPITAFDTNLMPWMHKSVAKSAKLHSELPEDHLP